MNSKGQTVQRPETCSGAPQRMPPHNAETGPTASAKAGVAGVPTMVGRPSGYELRVENDSCLATFETLRLAQP